MQYRKILVGFKIMPMATKSYSFEISMSLYLATQIKSGKAQSSKAIYQ